MLPWWGRGQWFKSTQAYKFSVLKLFSIIDYKLKIYNICVYITHSH